MTDDGTLEAEGESAFSLVERILAAFIKSVDEEEGYGDVAKRLTQILLDERELSEAALERALFEVEQS